MMDVLVTSEPDINSREVQWVDPRVWHPDRFSDAPDGYDYDGDGFDWNDETLLAAIRDEKIEECDSDFISSIEEGIINPIQIRVSDQFMKLPMGTTLLYNGHHRWFMAEELGLIVPIIIASERFFWEIDEQPAIISNGFHY